MIKHDHFTQRFYLSLRNTAVPMLFLFEISYLLHIGTLLLFTVRDYLFIFFLVEGSLLVILLHENCTNTHFFNINIVFVW